MLWSVTEVRGARMAHKLRRGGGSWAAKVATVTVGAMLIVLGVPAEAFAEPEPNDSMETAVPLTLGRVGIGDGQIFPAGDVDYYKFVTTTGGTFVAEAFNVAVDLGRIELSVRNAAGTELGVSSSCGTASTGNVCARVQVTVSIAGTYFLRLSGYSSLASGTYRVRVLPRYDQGLTWDSAGEPNDVLALAPEIGVGRTEAITRRIYPRNPDYYTVRAEEDYYRFVAQSAGTFVVEAFNVASDLGRVDLSVYNSAGTELGVSSSCGSFSSGNVCARVQVRVSIAGTYFVRVMPYSTVASGTYRLRVLPAFDQGHTWDAAGEPNDVIELAQGLKIGVTTATKTIYPRNPSYYTVRAETDMRHIKAQPHQTYVVTVSDVAAALGETNLAIYDRAGTVVARTTSGCNVASGPICNQLEFTPSIRATYFLEVRPNIETSSGSYQMCARLLAGSCV